MKSQPLKKTRRVKEKRLKAWMLGTGGTEGYCIYKTRKACQEREKDLPFANIPILPVTIIIHQPSTGV